MEYVVFDSFYEEVLLVSSDPYEVLDAANVWNYEEGNFRFIPLINNQYQTNPYTNYTCGDYYHNTYQYNPDCIPIPIKPTSKEWPKWKERVVQLLKEFNPRIDESVVQISDDFSTTKQRYRTKYIEFSTPRSEFAPIPYTYRIILGRDSGYTPELKTRGNNRYYSYTITKDYLDDLNREAVRAVFRLLFMGDEFLLPFLFNGNKLLTAPQQRAFDGFMDSYKRGDRRGAIILPTGIGKTLVAARIVAKKKPKRLLFISNRNFILKQAITTIREEAAENGWILEKSNIGHFYGQQYAITKRQALQKDYVFANPQSFNALLPPLPSHLRKRGVRLSDEDRIKRFSKAVSRWVAPDTFDFVIIDEFHHGNAQTWENIIKYFHPRYLLGLSATPHRSDDERPLELLNNNILYKASPWEKAQGIKYLTLLDALKLGYLVTPTIIPLIEPEYKTIYGEKVEVKDLPKVDKKIRGEKILKRYLHDATGKQAVVFCTLAEEATDLEKVFNAADIPSDHLLGTLEHRGCCRDLPGKPRRTEKLDKFRRGETQVLFVVDVLNEGIDISNIEVILWLRETIGVVRLLQQLGRGLRLDKGKRKLLVLDFMNNISRVQAYLKEGFIPTGWKSITKRRDTKKFKKDERELIKLLESQDLIKAGKDIELYTMTEGDEISDETSGLSSSGISSISQRISLPRSSQRLPKQKPLPKPSESQKISLSKSQSQLQQIKDEIIAIYSLPEDERPIDASSPVSLANKFGLCIYNVAQILHEAGFPVKKTPVYHPSDIEKRYSEEGQKQIINERIPKAVQEKLQRVFRAGETITGYRSYFGQKGIRKVKPQDECRIKHCPELGMHRGLCEPHYLFAWQEIREGRAFEDDLIFRFLMEPWQDLESLPESPQAESVSTPTKTKKPAKAKKKITKKKATKKKATKITKKKTTKKKPARKKPTQKDRRLSRWRRY